MRLLVTGASGFLGRYVVAEALRRGHDVRAVARAGGDPARYGWKPRRPGQVELVRVDLRSRRGLVDAARGVDAVLHLAAAKSGDVYEQYAGTVVATENLLWAMNEAGVRRLVHVSTFSVYDYMRLREWSVVDETAPVEHDAFDRDGYAHTKLVQEKLVRDAAAKHGWSLTVVRPGIIFGRDNLFNCNLGMQPSRRLWVRTGAWGRQPLTYVENCAEAIVLCAEKDQAAGQTFNVVDDDLPSQRAFMNALRRREKTRPFVLPVSWTVMRLLARSAWLTNKLLLGNRAKVPSILVPCRLHARIKPLRYTNRKIKEALGWRPRYGLEEAIDRSLTDDPPGDGGSGGPQMADVPAPLSPVLRGEGKGEGPRGETCHVGEGRRRVGSARHLVHDASSCLAGCARPLTPALSPGYGGEGVALRIGYMTGQYPRASDTFIQREVAALREAGVHVQTFSARPPPDGEMVGPEQAAERARTSYLLPPCPLEAVTAHGSLLARGPFNYLAALRLAISTRPPGLKGLGMQAAYFLEAGLLARRVRRHGLAHLHNHFADSSATVTLLAAALGDFTYSLTFHGPAEFINPRYWHMAEKVRRALFVNCISEYARHQTVLHAGQSAADKLRVVHCGVDVDSFHPAAHTGRGHRLLFVGRLAATKNLPVMLRALAALRRHRPDVHLTLAGDGPERVKLQTLALDMGVESAVTFLGYQSQAQVRDLLSKTDVFVLSSMAEGVPVVLMEAMAAGVPVAATRIAGIPELVEDGACGFLVPPDDPDALAAKLAALLDDPALRARFGAAGRAKVARDFNLRAEAGRMVRVLTEALGGHASPARPAVSAREPADASPPAQGVPVASA